jgi:hypothetical protein
VIRAHEFPMLGLLRHEYVQGVQFVDGCLTTAARLYQDIDRDRAATIEACRLVAMQSLRELADLIASVEERKAS